MTLSAGAAVRAANGSSPSAESTWCPCACCGSVRHEVMLHVLVALLPVSRFWCCWCCSTASSWWRARKLAQALVAGAGAAIAAALLHRYLLAAATGLPHQVLSRYVAPVTEEMPQGALRAVCPAQAIHRLSGRRGDHRLCDRDRVCAGGEHRIPAPAWRVPQIWLWIARGFGTAMMHAMTAAAVAIPAKSLVDRVSRRARSWRAARPAGRHRPAFRRSTTCWCHPLLAATVLMVLLPLVVLFVFDRSERATREWVGDGLDLDVELLNLVKSSHVRHHAARALSDRVEGRAFPVPSWRTCSACCSSISNCRSAPRAC